LSPSVLKENSGSETILIQLVSHSHRVRYLGCVSRRRLYLTDNMI